MTGALQADTAPVVLVTPKGLSGYIVRWYEDLRAAEYGPGAEIVSATRDGVLVRVFLHEVPDHVLADAHTAHQLLAADRRADARRFATHHRPRGLLRSPSLEPIRTPVEVDDYAAFLP